MADKQKKKLTLKVRKKSTKAVASKLKEKQEKAKQEAEQKKALEAERKRREAQKQKTPAKPKVPKTIFEDPEEQIRKQKEEAGKPKKGTKSPKSRLREDILRGEEHKKFFLSVKQQKKKQEQSPSKQSTPAISVPKEIKITEYVQVGELARKLHVKTSEIIAQLMKMGVMATITQSIDADTATLVASEYGCKVQVVSLYDETVIEEEPDAADSLQPRPPVVTVMGHVDHGKTKLLDAIRQTDVAASEAGGITQHIGAYQIKTKDGYITFLDTPGHEAFSAMRARGAQITDLVVLVVAADDGIKPQTIEAIHHAKDAKVPIIVAINKIDLEEANPEKVKQELTQYELVPEEWGGDTPVIAISALKKQNLDTLLEVIHTTAEILELKANPNKRASGTVIEAELDQGRGPVATLLVQSGTLKQSDPLIAGLEGGRVRALLNDRGEKLKEAPPSMPVEVLGLSGVPNAGDPFHVLKSEKEVKSIMEKRQELARQQQAQARKKVNLENLNTVIEEGKLQELKIIIKADVKGSAEALENALTKLSNPEVKVNVIFSSTGEITESDVMLASAGNAIIIGFNTRANARVRDIATKEGVEIRYYNIIYNVIDDITQAIEGMLSPDIAEEVIGEVEIRQIFKISSVGTVGGSMVTSGVIRRNSMVRVIREGVVLYEGKLASLKRFQEDVAEVKEGFECGVLIAGFNDIKAGDRLEVFEKVEKKRSIEEIQENSEKPTESQTDHE